MGDTRSSERSYARSSKIRRERQSVVGGFFENKKVSRREFLLDTGNRSGVSGLTNKWSDQYTWCRVGVSKRRWSRMWSGPRVNERLTKEGFMFRANSSVLVLVLILALPLVLLAQVNT